MYQVKYDLPDVQTSLEFLLEQVIYGAEAIICRDGVEIARVTGIKRPPKSVVTEISRPHEAKRLSRVS